MDALFAEAVTIAAVEAPEIALVALSVRRQQSSAINPGLSFDTSSLCRQHEV